MVFIIVSTFCRALGICDILNSGIDDALRTKQIPEHYVTNAREREREGGGERKREGEREEGGRERERGGESCLLYTSPSPRDMYKSRMPSSA